MSKVKIALNMSMVKFIMWEKGPDYTFDLVKKSGVSYFELSQVDMTDDFIKATIDASEKHGVKVIASSVNYQPLFGQKAYNSTVKAHTANSYEFSLGIKRIKNLPRMA